MKGILFAGASLLISGASIAQTTAAPDTPPVIVTAPVTQDMVSGTLPAGTVVRFRMDKALATDKREIPKGEKKPDKNHQRISNPGDSFTMTTVKDVSVDGYVVIPAGSRGIGEVTMVTGRGGFGKSGKIEIKLHTLQLAQRTYAMDGTYLQKGKGRGGAAVAGTIIAGAIAGAFIKGDDADIPLATEIDFRTKEAITYTAPRAAVEAAKP